MNKIAFVLNGVRMPLSRTIILMSCLTLLAMWTMAGCGDDENTVNFPDQPEAQTQNWLFDVHGTGPSDIYAAGNKGVMFHFDGSSWNLMDSGTSNPIVTLWENNGTMYAVGHGGNILRNTGGSWSSMDSGTGNDLYGIGEFQDALYACGAEGTLRRMSGSSWSSTPTVIVLRDPSTGAPTDTLSRTADLSSLVTVNHFFIGGAFKNPDYDGEMIGTLGTDGMVLTGDPEYDWLMRPLRGDQLAASERVLSTTSDPLVLANNFLGTTEGWLFQLVEDEEAGTLVWSKRFPRVTSDPGRGIRDMWLDGDGYVYLVTDSGQLVIQSVDYSLTEGTGFRKLLYDQVPSLTGIWGAGSDNFYMVGLMSDKLLQASIDFSDTTLVGPVDVMVDFPDKSWSSGLEFGKDELGRNRF